MVGVGERLTMTEDGITGEFFEGYKVTFPMGRFDVSVYMTKVYYEGWKYFRDAEITDVWVEEVKLDLVKFLK